MKLGADRAVDDPGLEARVHITKRCRRCHEDKVSRIAQRQQGVALILCVLRSLSSISVAVMAGFWTGDYRYHRAKTLPSSNHHLDDDLQHTEHHLHHHKHTRSMPSTTSGTCCNIWHLQYMPHHLRHLQHMSYVPCHLYHTFGICRVPSSASAAYGTAFTSTNLQHTLDGAGAGTIVNGMP
jgi:hypothetical protein